MDLHLTEKQAELLVAELDRIIENDRYPLSPRITALREIRAPARQQCPRKGSTSRRARADIAGGEEVAETGFRKEDRDVG